MKQYEAVIETLKRLGGCATFGQLKQEMYQCEAGRNLHIAESSAILLSGIRE